jgi:DNA-directed RNA polymerase sigma subunit (sigma70/sigma32)
MTLPIPDEKISPLLNVLDDDIRYVETTLARLDTLRTLVIKRDDKALQKLLEEIHQHGNTHAENEQKRRELQRELSTELKGEEGEVTLSRLLCHTAGETHDALRERQKKLKSLISKLKHEYTLTALLVADFSRLNRSLMRAFFGPTKSRERTYSPSGAATYTGGMAMLNLQF